MQLLGCHLQSFKTVEAAVLQQYNIFSLVLLWNGHKQKAVKGIFGLCISGKAEAVISECDKKIEPFNRKHHREPYNEKLLTTCSFPITIC